MFDADKAFSGAIPQFYERYLVLLIFDPYARDLAARVTPKVRSRNRGRYQRGHARTCVAVASDNTNHCDRPQSPNA
jgi:hypothetical protein